MIDESQRTRPAWQDTEPVFSALDRHFARLMGAMAHSSPTGVAIAAALASRAVGQGSVCLDLSRWASAPLTVDGAGPCPDLEPWRSQLLASGMVGTPGERKPLILDTGHRLYLHRYWSYEQRTAEVLLKRAAMFRHVPAGTMAAALGRLFGDPSPAAANGNWQAMAACVAAVKGLCILSGGPGTGKTYTAVRIMAVLQSLSDRPLHMVMAAPTGKAAGRLVASLSAARKDAGGDADLFRTVPEEAFTLHRLLGIRPGAVRPRHHPGNPLSADVVVIDEASMIDISLMCRLLEAVPATATLVLIGDRDQLSSVEAGAVFGDICRVDEGRRLSPALQSALAPVMTIPPGVTEGAGGLSDCLVFLQRVHRFAVGGAMERLFEAVNSGNAAGLTSVLRSGQPELSWLPEMVPAECRAWLLPKLGRQRRDLASRVDPHQALAQLGRWQVLCAINNGPWGVGAVNEIGEAAIDGDQAPHGRLDRPRWYAGMPVLVLQNDYELGLYNGDVGIVLPEEGRAANGLAAVFAAKEGRVTAVDPLRLPAHEPAHALTVHKSQGSEFDHVVLMLPDRDVPVLSRELLYTGMTRAKKSLTVIAPVAVLETAIGREIRRPSGLGQALWGEID